MTTPFLLQEPDGWEYNNHPKKPLVELDVEGHCQDLAWPILVCKVPEEMNPDLELTSGLLGWIVYCWMFLDPYINDARRGPLD